MKFHFTIMLVITSLGLLAGCSSTPKKPKVGECIRKDSKNYRESVYKVLRWEADGTPEVRDLVTTKTKTLLDYEPPKYRVVDCPKSE